MADAANSLLLLATLSGARADDSKDLQIAAPGQRKRKASISSQGSRGSKQSKTTNQVDGVSPRVQSVSLLEAASAATASTEGTTPDLPQSETSQASDATGGMSDSTNAAGGFVQTAAALPIGSSMKAAVTSQQGKPMYQCG